MNLTATGPCLSLWPICMYQLCRSIAYSHLTLTSPRHVPESLHGRQNLFACTSQVPQVPVSPACGTPGALREGGPDETEIVDTTALFVLSLCYSIQIAWHIAMCRMLYAFEIQCKAQLPCSDLRKYRSVKHENERHRPGDRRIRHNCCLWLRTFRSPIDSGD